MKPFSFSGKRRATESNNTCHASAGFGSDMRTKAGYLCGGLAMKFTKPPFSIEERGSVFCKPEDSYIIGFPLNPRFTASPNFSWT